MSWLFWPSGSPVVQAHGLCKEMSQQVFTWYRGSGVQSLPSGTSETGRELLHHPPVPSACPRSCPCPCRLLFVRHSRRHPSPVTRRPATVAGYRAVSARRAWSSPSTCRPRRPHRRRALVARSSAPELGPHLRNVRRVERGGRR